MSYTGEVNMSVNIKSVYPPFAPDYLVALENRKTSFARYTANMSPKSIAERVDPNQAHPPIMAETMEREAISRVHKFIADCLPIDNELIPYFAANAIEKDIIKRINARRSEIKTQIDLFLLMHEAIHDLEMRLIFERILKSRAKVQELIQWRVLASAERHREFIELLADALNGHMEKAHELVQCRIKQGEAVHQAQEDLRLAKMAKPSPNQGTSSPVVEPSPRLSGNQKAAGVAPRKPASPGQKNKNIAAGSASRAKTPPPSLAKDSLRESMAEQNRAADVDAAGSDGHVTATMAREKSDIDVADRLARESIEGRKGLEFHINMRETNQKLAAMETAAHYVARDPFSKGKGEGDS